MDKRYSLIDAFFLLSTSVETFRQALEKAEGETHLKESLRLLHRQTQQLVNIHRSAVDRAQDDQF